MSDSRILIILLVMACVIIGWLVADKLLGVSGELIIDTSDPEKDKWLFRLREPPKHTSRRHTVKLLVLHRKIQEEEQWQDET